MKRKLPKETNVAWARHQSQLPIPAISSASHVMRRGLIISLIRTYWTCNCHTHKVGTVHLIKTNSNQRFEPEGGLINGTSLLKDMDTNEHSETTSHSSCILILVFILAEVTPAHPIPRGCRSRSGNSANNLTRCWYQKTKDSTAAPHVLTNNLCLLDRLLGRRR